MPTEEDFIKDGFIVEENKHDCSTDSLIKYYNKLKK